MSDLSVLAEAILSGDHSEIYGALGPYLTARDHKALAAAIELCPHHECDLQICFDDKASCVGEAMIASAIPQPDQK